MKTFFLHIALVFTTFVFSQNEQLAQDFFNKGDFDKAAISYEQLLESQPSNSFYFQRLVESYQQLSQFDKAEKKLLLRLEKYKKAFILVEIGYNYQLKKDLVKAKNFYEQALGKIKENPLEVYPVASIFEKKVLLDYALKAYQTATSVSPEYNFDYQIAMLHGQLGNTDLMIDKFLTEAYNKPETAAMIQYQLSRYMTENAEDTFNLSLKKALLLRAQKTQDLFWNQYLSWFFVQQKEYSKAFLQEKAIYKRNPESLSNIVNLSQLAIEEKEPETAQEILAYVLENTQDIDLKIQAHTFLLNLKIEKATEKEYTIINTEIEALIKEFGINPFTLSLQILQAHFVTFNMKNPELGKNILKTALQLPLNKYEEADAKMELADVFLFEEKFNQALINYSQIEEDLKNDEVGHVASLKSAKTSYFKGDFDWALKQFKTLKSASSQLIANDALELFLLINDNTIADSTQTALKKFARGDYFLYQNKTQQALTTFLEILKESKGNEIESVTLYRLGKTYEKLKNYNLALSQYQNIIDNHNESIYIDEALYFSAEIFNKELKDVEKAKALYEKILFTHEDSIYFIDARKKFRQLRGDTNL